MVVKDLNDTFNYKLVYDEKHDGMKKKFFLKKFIIIFKVVY